MVIEVRGSNLVCVCGQVFLAAVPAHTKFRVFTKQQREDFSCPYLPPLAFFPGKCPSPVCVELAAASTGSGLRAPLRMRGIDKKMPRECACVRACWGRPGGSFLRATCAWKKVSLPKKNKISTFSFFEQEQDSGGRLRDAKGKKKRDRADTWA